MKNLILAYERGMHRIKSMSKALENLDQEFDIVTKDFDNIQGPYNKIWTLSESLLPVQAKYEREWGLSDLSDTAAEILTDKKKFDDFCCKIGLKDLIPKSVIPTKKEDLFSCPIIVKPTIGSGSKQDGFAYSSFYSKEEFLENMPNNFFTINKEGFRDQKFNNEKSYYMIQEKLPSHAKIYAPYFFIDNNGNLNNIFWIRMQTKIIARSNSKFIEMPISVEVTDRIDVPDKLKEAANTLYESLSDMLNLRNFFFSGPDFYIWDNNIKLIDCNPRIGQGLEIMDKMHNNKLISSIINGNQIDIKKRFLWKSAELNPGKIKSIKDYSHIKKHITVTSYVLEPEITILEQSNVSDNYFNVSFQIEQDIKKPDMDQTYQALRSELQDCIEYY